MSIEEPKTEYDIKAEQFLEKFGLQVSFKLVDCDVPKWEKNSGNYHNHYKVTTKRTERTERINFTFPLTFSFDWWDSTSNTDKDIKPTAYDALSSISSDSQVFDSFEDFCGEFGYDEDSREAERIWKSYSKLSAKVNAFFTEEELEALSEIQ
jgi:hypothetical protein